MQRHYLRNRSFLSSIFVLVLASGAWSCGASSAPKDTGSAASNLAQPKKSEGAETSEQKFARQTADAVGKMCQRLIECSFEDARKEMNAQKLAELEESKAGLRARAVGECSDEYGGAGLSPRQVIGMRKCLSEPTECTDFVQCLSDAMN